MKPYLHTLFTNALIQLQVQGDIPQDIAIDIHLERTRDARFGDFACNAAMILAKAVKMRPRDLAARLIEHLSIDDELIAKVEIAGPGFINVFLTLKAYRAVIDDILSAQTAYGRSQMGAGQSVMIEFVSANPTGPLHVGHGRGAAYGAALAHLLTTAGFKVHQEYYVNDAGRQMDILALSVWLRYLELCGESVNFPANGYQGDYVWDIAASLHREQGEAWRHSASSVFENIASEGEQGFDKEKDIDALIARCQDLLGETAYSQVGKRALDTILDEIRRDLKQFGVVYDEWFSESNLTTTHTVTRAIEQLKAAGHTYEQDGALWFCSSAFGDEKDRVLVRENGQATYFASDIAYHLNKLERGFDHLINIWGADHHGYVPRVKAAMTALGAEANRLTVLLVQFASLFRGKERLAMSTRSGSFVTLRELREEVGRDAARFFYIQRKSEQHLNFDLELAKSQTNDNPVYYIQYAHTRIASVFRELHNKDQVWDHNQASLSRLVNEREQTLLKKLSHYPEVIENAAQAYEPHQLTYYLRELAQDFHAFYDAKNERVLVEDEELRNARLSLCVAVQQVLRNGLTIIGVSAPEVM
ncbi:MAG: arginine--tRNA ligase [Candidatus Parabeggiatoa sp. nov. 3]|nr:MAG: arginine--tRNA ligase [Gammaproteobacteria bacterium]RKZ57570.1 MAG: arginine--tRNA ligase [Gammaproteobacteria bacterium]RKZ80262.1 MAG: arginine--tRNA ligase [Gammaproteobacteria bacterium]